MDSGWIRQVTILALLGALLVLGFAVLQSFLVPLLWAAILAYVSWAPHQYFVGLFQGARTPAALVMTLLMTLAVIVPMASVFLLLRPEAVDAFRSAQAFLASGLRVPDFLLRLPLLGPHLAELNAHWTSDPEALNTALRGLVNSSYGQMGSCSATSGAICSSSASRSSACSSCTSTGMRWQARSTRCSVASSARAPMRT